MPRPWWNSTGAVKRGSAWFGAAWPFGLVALALVALVLLLAASRSKPVTQPVAFNHRVHTQRLELGCEFCHQGVSTGARAGLPDAQVCGACHQAPQGKTPEAAKVTALLARNDPLRFRKLFHLADYVYFSHRRHVEIGKLECRQCHGGIAATERPPTHPLMRINRMSFCLGCHRAKKQSLDCVACHR